MHAVNRQFHGVPALLGVGNFFDLLLMHLEHVHNQTVRGAELAVTHGAREVLGLLMLDKYLLVVKVPVAVVAPWLDHFLLLFLPHAEGALSRPRAEVNGTLFLSNTTYRR